MRSRRRPCTKSQPWSSKRAGVFSTPPRHAAKDEKVGQDVDHVDRFELAIGADRQALVRELIDHIEHPVLAAIMGAVLDEVVGPDMVGMLGPQADAGAIGQPQPSAFGLLGRHFQSFAMPDPLHPAVADRPAGLSFSVQPSIEPSSS